MLHLAPQLTVAIEICNIRQNCIKNKQNTPYGSSTSKLYYNNF